MRAIDIGLKPRSPLKNRSLTSPRHFNDDKLILSPVPIHTRCCELRLANSRAATDTWSCKFTINQSERMKRCESRDCWVVFERECMRTYKGGS